MTPDSPTPENELIVAKTDVGPINSQDKRSLWRRFIDGLRQTVGLKPLYMAEEWAQAKIGSVNADSAAKRLQAMANYELATSQARLNDAIADQIRDARAVPSDLDSYVKKLREASNTQPEVALEQLKEAIRRIQLAGGSVEFEFPDEE